jgi:large subunit ribosomal protein L18
MKSKKLRSVRHKRLRKKVKGSGDKPRLCVFRSSKHIYAQIIDDDRRVILLSVSTQGKESNLQKIKPSTKEAAFVVGELIAKRAVDSGIKSVCFDSGGYRYHGRVKKLSEGARKGGLVF